MARPREKGYAVNVKKIMLLAAGLALVACGPRLPATEADPDQLTLSGTVQEGRIDPQTETLRRTAWSQGQRPLRAWVGSAWTGVPPLASTTIATNGSFAVTLPRVPETQLVGLFLDDEPFEGCTISEVSATPGLRGAPVQLFAEIGGNVVPVAPMEFTATATATGGTVTIRAAHYLYADRAGAVRGREVCAFAGVQTTTVVDIQLQRGWNRLTESVTVTVDGDNMTFVARYDNSTPPTGWVASFDDLMPLASNEVVQAMSVFKEQRSLFRLR